MYKIMDPVSAALPKNLPRILVATLISLLVFDREFEERKIAAAKARQINLSEMNDSETGTFYSNKNYNSESQINIGSGDTSVQLSQKNSWTENVTAPDMASGTK